MGARSDAPAADLLGAHMSIAGGLANAVHRAVAAGCGAVQIFLKNQLRWAGRPLDAGEVAEFRRALTASGLGAAFAHASYLINLATPEPDEWARAVTAMTGELERAERLGLPFVVLHAGSHRGAGMAAGVARLAQALDELAVRTAGWRVRIALENTAGGGRLLGGHVRDLGQAFTRVRRPERLALCLDTCHLFAAGHDIRTAAGFRRVLDEVDRVIGLDHVVACHLNDAKAGLGSGLDRHEHIGRGQLGLEPFRFLLTHRRLGGIPMVIETPKRDDGDVRNLATLRRLRSRGAGLRRR